MSISGSQEVKTALLDVNTGAGTTRTASLAAQEDREIVGWHDNVFLDPGSAAPDRAEARVSARIGPDQFDDNVANDKATARDNRNWHVRNRYAANEDDVNGDGGEGPQSSGQWYGHDSGIEWNEDATLNYELVAGGARATAHLTVYYREL